MRLLPSLIPRPSLAPVFEHLQYGPGNKGIPKVAIPNKELLTHSRVVYPVIGQVEMVIVCSCEVAGVQKLGYETSPTHIQQAGQHGASTLAL